MWRYLVGAFSALALVSTGFFLWQAQADRPASPIPPVPPTLIGAAAPSPLGLADLAPPPVASERTREEKRFARYDRNKNGVVGRDEYLYSRQRAFARLDTNGDGRIDFNEYAVKASAKFVSADRDRNGALGATEFAATRVVRKTKARSKPNCPPPLTRPEAEPEES
jgi:hypothetical protein